jgi:hypothetical protein
LPYMFVCFPIHRFVLQEYHLQNQANVSFVALNNASTS